MSLEESASSPLEAYGPPPAAPAAEAPVVAAQVVGPSSRDRWVDFALVWGVAIGPLIFASTLGFLPGTQSDSSGQSPAMISILTSVFNSLSGLGVLAYVLWRQNRLPADIGLSFHISDIPVSFALYLLTYIAYMIVAASLPTSNLLTLSPGETDSPFHDFVAAPVGAMMLLILVNPFFEELIVRAYAMVEIEELTRNRWLAIFVTALVQGYYHLYQGWQTAVSHTASFLVLSIYFSYSRRATPLILSHMYADAIGTYGLFAMMAEK
jgi:membrane protease YdiL (CAAX protease family)